MNCIDEVRKAFFLSWVGDKEYVERVRRECKDQFGETGLKERIAKAIEKVSWDWEIPLALRDDGIDSAQLVSGAISEFLERLSATTESREIHESHGVRYSVSDFGVVQVLRGYCDKCFGYRFEREGGGFGIRYENLIYVEGSGDLIKIMLKLLKDKQSE